MRLTEAQHERVAPLLPPPRCKLTAAQRQMLGALFHIAGEGCTWRALPAEFGPWHTICMRLNHWVQAGVLARVASELQRDKLAALCLDSTIVKLDADRAGALRTGGARRSAARAAA